MKQSLHGAVFGHVSAILPSSGRNSPTRRFAIRGNTFNQRFQRRPGQTFKGRFFELLASAPRYPVLARSIFSVRHVFVLAREKSVRNRGFELGSPPPMRARCYFASASKDRRSWRRRCLRVFIVGPFELAQQRRPLFSFATARASHRAAALHGSSFVIYRRPVAIFADRCAQFPSGDLR